MVVLARNCESWYDTLSWRGNCKKHPWEHDKFSQSAECRDCLDFVDKYAKYNKRGISDGPKVKG